MMETDEDQIDTMPNGEVILMMLCCLVLGIISATAVWIVVTY